MRFRLALLGTFWILLSATIPSSVGGPSHESTPSLEVQPPPSAPTYGFTIHQVGLAPSVSWEVGLGRSGTGLTNWSVTSGPTFLIKLANGTYSLSVSAEGDFAASQVPHELLVNGSEIEINVTFVPAEPVQFNETGLPWGAGWTVNLTSENYSVSETLTGQNFTALATGLPFYFNVSSPGYVPSPARGNITSWPNGTFSIRFARLSRPTYDGIIEGIVNIGRLAKVYIGGVPETVGAEGTFSEALPPGFYGIVVTAPGYTPWASVTDLKANGSEDVPVVLNRTLVGSTNPTANSSGLDGWDAAALAIGAGAFGAAVTYLAVRRRPRAPSERWT